MKIHLSRFDNIVVFGSGTIAGLCVEFLRKQTSGRIFVFEKKDHSISTLEKHISAMQDTYYRAIEDEIEETVLQIKPKIIFSIGSSYIFRKPLVDVCPIINYHNALLPRHPGRNAEAWAIFSQDGETGVTWHWVERTVDTGDVIMQRAIPLTTSITSIKLLSLQAKLAFDMFQEIAEKILEGQELPSQRQKYMGSIQYHYSWDRPNGGILDAAWDFRTISAFLRAMDYGRLFLLGKSALMADGVGYTWKKYSFKPPKGDTGIVLNWQNNLCTISKREGSIELQGLERMQSEAELEV